MKKCPNNHDNPDNAKFCRICGYSFDNSFWGVVKNNWITFKSKAASFINGLKLISTRSSCFTPSLFPCISLTPSSVVNIDFQCKKGLVTILVALFLFIALWYYRQRLEFILFYKFSLPYILLPYLIPIFFMLIGIVFFVKFFPLLRSIIRWARYRLNVDYIESVVFMQNTYRVAKNGKLGLFDMHKKKVLLTCQYHNIIGFDSNHVLIEKNGKKGLYSMNKAKIIVPVLFDRIENFRNSIVKCQKGSMFSYYDVNGNKMK